MGQTKRPDHSDAQHEFRFFDIVDKGDIINKVYKCVCGARQTEVYWLMETHREPMRREQDEKD